LTSLHSRYDSGGPHSLLPDHAGNDERNFLAESERAEKDRAIFDRIQRAVSSLRFVVVIETALIVALLIILIAR
jgi:hypothetical protein